MPQSACRPLFHLEQCPLFLGIFYVLNALILLDVFPLVSSVLTRECQPPNCVQSFDQLQTLGSSTDSSTSSGMEVGIGYNTSATDLFDGVFCRGSTGRESPANIFLLSSCYQCFTFIYGNLNLSVIPRDLPFLERRNAMKMNMFCEATGDGECHSRVNSCCEAAELCCLQQKRSLPVYIKRKHELCPTTWDMLSCIPMTPKNTTANVLCPSFMWQGISGVYGTKKCQANATWATKSFGDQTWEVTEYRPCFVAIMNKTKLLTILRLTFNCISLLCLFASLCLFLGIKSLRAEKRIQMHVNLFTALFMQLLFGTFIQAVDLQQYSVIDGGKGKSIYEHKFCKFIGIANRFFNSATYTWYVCEAIFLYQLLHRAFDTMKSLRFFYLGGWGIPLVINGIYCAIRQSFQLTEETMSSAGRCWLNDLQYLEWVHRGPILLELIMNTGFLIYILYTVWNLQNVYGDGSNYKNSVRAALLLAPLFGLNFILVMIHRENYGYNIFQCILGGSQGALVAIIFCFNNEEVKTAIQASIRRRGFNISRTKRSSSAKSGCTVYTSVPLSSTRASRGQSASSIMTTNAARNDSVPLATYGRHNEHKASTISAPALGRGYRGNF